MRRKNRLEFLWVLGACVLSVGLLSTAGAQSSGQGAPIENTMPLADYQKVISQGPQKMIAGLEVVPHSLKGRFVGFKLVRILAHSPLANSQLILVGDVILSVNDHALERPDQFMRAWEALAKAKRLDVRVLRGDVRLHYRWTLVP